MVANKCFEGVTKFIYFEATVMNQNSIHEKIKSKLNKVRAIIRFRIFCPPVSCLKSQIKIHKSIILPVVL
jgi:hypothetical protein